MKTYDDGIKKAIDIVESYYSQTLPKSFGRYVCDKIIEDLNNERKKNGNI